jgi:hypothetical protein
MEPIMCLRPLRSRFLCSIQGSKFLLALRAPVAMLALIFAVTAHASPTASPSDTSPGLTYLPADPALSGLLDSAIGESEAGEPTWILLPTLAGDPVVFEVREVQSRSPELVAHRSDLRSYAATAVDRPRTHARISAQRDGLRVLVDSPEGVYRLHLPRLEAADFRLEHPIDELARAQAAPCGVVHTAEDAIRLGHDFRSKSQHHTPVQIAGTLATYRLALASTVEFTALNGGVVATEEALDALVNEANFYLERNFAIRLHLTAMSIFEQEPDPFTSGNNELMLDEAATFFRSLAIPDGFGIGHVLDVTGGGRAALAMVCDENWKGAAVSDGRSLQTFLHELGHQFSASHSFNDNASGECGNPEQYAAFAAYEPGSGSTLMSYGGACGLADLQRDRDMYFHSSSIAQVVFFIADGNGIGSLCRSDFATGNHGILLVQTSDEVHVPPLISFQLSVQALDADGDEVGIRWEQYDLGLPEPPHGDDADRPIFRSRPGSVEGTRSFPSLSLLFENHEGPPVYYNCGTVEAPQSCLVGEFLPARPRTLRFRATASDDRDAIEQRDVLVHVVADAAPFRILSPDLDSPGWLAGHPATVTWEVGQTAESPIQCFHVNILLSLDDGGSFPHQLATLVPNSGSYQVQVPEVLGNAVNARLKVKCDVLGNHHGFFAVSNAFPVVETVVSHNGDAGFGSLRTLLELARQYAGPISIRFQLPFTQRLIQPQTPLPVIETRVILDGWSQSPGGIGTVPRVEINGAALAPETENPHGLVLRSQLSEVSGLAITGFAGDGIRIEGGGFHRIHSNWLGLNRCCADPSGNGGAGLRIIESNGNIVGLGPVSELRGNTIVGNAVGVVLEGQQSGGNRLAGNWIGTNDQSATGLGNHSAGVLILEAPGNDIGDFLQIDGIDAIPRGNVISGNQPLNANGVGVRISGADAVGNRVRANLVGLRADGLAAGLPNGGTGVLVDGAIDTLVDRNLIAANPVGIRVDGEDAGGTRITGNWIGLESTGQMTIPGGIYGIWLRRPAEVGGADVGMGNVVAGQSVAGIYIDGVTASGSVVRGNRIGSDPDGIVGLGNGYGVRIFSSSDHLIGGSVAGEGNLITASNSDNLRLEGGSSRVRVEGNRIGTDLGGTVALSRHGAGFNVAVQGGSDNRIGGTAPGAGNLISGFGPLEGGNTHGIGLRVWAGAEGNRIEGNRIGTDASGTAALGNGGAGIWVAVPAFEPSPLQSISIAGNLVAGNAGAGVELNGVDHVRVHGNAIGVSLADGVPLGNGGSGVRISSGSDNWIGVPGEGEGNRINHSGTSAFALGHGVQVVSGQRNRIVGNRIHDNAGLGIDLLGGADGVDRVTPNDACDADTGPNGLQNYPLLTGVEATPKGSILRGNLNSRPSTAFFVDIYRSDACDEFGHGEGGLWLGRTTVTTDESCDGDFSLLLGDGASGMLTATATDQTGNTSEFSACLEGLPAIPIFDNGFEPNLQ